MGVFGLINVVDDLAKGDPTRWGAVMELENSTALLAMQMAVARAWIEYRMRETK